MSGSSSSTYLKRGYKKHATVIIITNTPNKMVSNAIPHIPYLNLHLKLIL